MRQRKLKDNDRAPQSRNRGRVAERVEQPEPHPAPAISLNAGDIGDRRYVVIVKPMTEAKYRGRQERELEAIRACSHGCISFRQNLLLFHTEPIIGNPVIAHF